MRLSLLAATLLCVACASGGAGSGTETTPAASPPPASAAPASAQTSAGATVVDFTGDWEYTAALREGAVDGRIRLNRRGDGYTGVVTRNDMPPSPVRSFVVRDRSFTLTVEFNGELYTYAGRLETATSVTGTLTLRSSVGRLRMTRR